jgi:hypothetical protein
VFGTLNSLVVNQEAKLLSFQRYKKPQNFTTLRLFYVQARGLKTANRSKFLPLIKREVIVAYKKDFPDTYMRA